MPSLTSRIAPPAQPTKETPVGQWVAHNPAYAQTFEKLDIDFCCGGKTSLWQACVKGNHNIDTVISQLLQEATVNSNADIDCTSLTLSQLCHHIVTTHHHYLLEKLPYIQKLIQKVVNAHGGKDPRLPELLKVFVTCKTELLSHMQKEEQVLFPMILQMEEQQNTQGSTHCGNIDNPIRMMEMEHDDAGEALAQIKQLTDNYNVPAGACSTYQIMLHELEVFEKDMHQHIHKENNILFPAASKYEAALNSEKKS